jgi:capsular exopolysaccharide synthesis family protein
VADSLFEEEQPTTQQSGFSLDFKRVLSRAIRFWYVVVIILGSSLAWAFYINRYTQRVYPVTASVIIKEVQDMGGAELLYKNSLLSPYRNYLNEPYILKSYPLVEGIVRDLNFHVSFLQEGYVVTSELYKDLPIKAVWCGGEKVQTGKFIFTLTDEDTFTLEPMGEDSEGLKTSYQLEDSIEWNAYQLCIKRIAGKRIKPYINLPLILEVKNPTSVAGSYIGRLSVKWAELGAGVLNLSITGVNPEKEIDFLNAMIRNYAQLDLDKKNEAASRTVDFIEAQLKEIRDSLRTVEVQLERFGNTGRVKDMSSEAQRLYAKLEPLEFQRAELAIRKNYFDYLNRYFNQASADRYDQIILPTSMGINDPILGALLSKYVEAQTEVAQLTIPGKSENPLVRDRMALLKELRKNIDEAIRTLIATDKIKLDFLSRQIATLESQLDLLPTSERRLIAIQRNYSLLENLYVFLMQKLSEAKISKAASTSDIIPVDPPMRGGAISPKPMQNYLIAGVAGLAIPLLIFILFELLNNKVQSKEDVEKMTTIPFIGGVGHNAATTNLIVREKPKSGVAESFRALRSNLNYFTSNKTKQVFMVSSSISGEGKTFTTINLATVFALSGKRTLIVGADMRRPKIFEDFGGTNTHGLSTYLSELHEFDTVVQQTEIKNLFFISGGPVPPNPSELLLKDRFDLFVRTALEKFDYVIIDTPPLALVTDAFVISKFVDHTVFVLRQNYSPKDFVRSIDEFYRLGKIKNISIMLNDIYKSGLGYGYGQGYSYSYSYGYGYGYGYSSRKKNGQGYYEE